MTRPFRLQPLLNLAQMNSETATRKLGELNKQQHDRQAQLDMLLQYRRDYQARMQLSSQQSMDPVMLRNFQAFINKLDTAIAQQTQIVEQCQRSTQMGRGEFDNSRRKLKSFDTLQQRHIETEHKIEAKKEQHDTDERTGRMMAYRQSEADKSND